MDYLDTLGLRAIKTNTAGRVKIAVGILKSASTAQLGSRAMDNCFECNDGDRVVAGILAASRTDPALHAALRAWPASHYVNLADWERTAALAAGEGR